MSAIGRLFQSPPGQKTSAQGNVVSPLDGATSQVEVGSNKPIRVKISESVTTTLPGFSAKASARSASLFVEISQTLGVRQSQVGARCNSKYAEHKLEETISQLQHNPKDALSDEPISFVVHQVQHSKEVAGGLDTTLVVLQPDSDNERLYTAHVTLKEATELVDIVAFNGAPNMPDIIDKTQPTHLVAWALHLIDLQTDQQLALRLQEFAEESRHDLEFAKKTSEELEAMSDEVSYNHVRWFLQQLTSIRLSSTLGTRRLHDVIYVYSGDHKAIGLSKKLLSQEQRAEIRSNLHPLQYTLHLFAPPCTTNGVFSEMEILICKENAFTMVSKFSARCTS